MLQDDKITECFNRIIHNCKFPDGNKDSYSALITNIFGEIFGEIFGFKVNNFRGGSGQDRTMHENIFSILFPELKGQVTFGTGRGGFKKYLSKKFVADFYDEENQYIIEIDGKSHNNEIRKIKDDIRDCFFYIEHNIKTARFTNNDIEKMLLNRISKLSDEDLNNILEA